MELVSLEVVYLWQLRELVSIERQLADLFAEIADGASGEPVARSAAWHREQCNHHADDVASLITSSGAAVGRRLSRGMSAIVGEVEELLQSTGDAQAVDAAVLGAVRKAVHYELAALRAAIATATLLGHDSDLTLVLGIVQRSKAADRFFASVALECEPSREPALAGAGDIAPCHGALNGHAPRDN